MTKRNYESGKNEALATIADMSGGTVHAMDALMARSNQDIIDAIEIHGEVDGKDIIESAKGARDAYHNQRTKLMNAANRALDLRQIDKDEYWKIITA